MKRFFIFLVILILLCACAKAEPEQAPSTLQQVSEDENGNIVFTIDKIKDLGEYENTAENYSRYYDEFVGEFIPSDDYGEIIPFIGRRVSYWDDQYEFRYGFCTLDGEIVCDAVYGYTAAVYTDNYNYYLMRIPADIGVLDSEKEYHSVYEEKCVLIRSDGQKLVELNYVDYGYISASGTIIRVEEKVFNGEKYESNPITFNEDLEEISPSAGFGLGNAHKEAMSQLFYGVCDGCNENVTLDTPIIESAGFYSDDFKLKGFIHYNCKGGNSIIDPEGNLIVTTPKAARIYNEEITEDYFFCTLTDNPEFSYDTMDDTAFIYNRNTKEEIILPEYNILTQIDKDKFTMVHREHSDDYSPALSYNTETEQFTEVSVSGKINKIYTICVIDGESVVRDIDYNEIIRIRIGAD